MISVIVRSSAGVLGPRPSNSSEARRAITCFINGTGTSAIPAATGPGAESKALVAVQPASASVASVRNGRNMGDLVGWQVLPAAVAEPARARKR